MKAILRGYGIRMNTEQRQNARAQAADMTRTRGTSRVPFPPRDVVCQAGPQGLLVTWNYPAGFSADIQRWRVYKADENTLYAEIKDRGTRQYFVASTNGKVVNIFVSALNASGVESPKVSGQGTPSSATAAMPSVPPDYNLINSGGADRSTDFQ